MPDEHSCFEVHLDILSNDERWEAIQNQERWSSDFNKILVKLSKSGMLCCLREPVELSVCLTNDEHIHNLNKEFRQKDKPTNVLAFPSVISQHLGDVVLSYETIRTEADAQNKDFIFHTWHLFLHGVLHLLGYNHENDEDEEKMKTIEIEILNTLGVNNPYEDIF